MATKGRPTAWINIKTNDRPAVAGIKRVGQGLASLGTVGAAGATAVAGAAAGFALLSVRALAASDAVGKVGARVGLTAEQVSGLQHAAELGGAGARDMDTAMTALARRAAAQPKLFEKWGVSVRDANGQIKPTRELLGEVSDRMANAGSQAEKLAIAQDLMSEAGRKLVPALEAGNEALEATEREAKRLGVTIDSVESLSAAKLADRFGLLSSQVSGLQRVVGSALAPAIEAVGSAATEVIADMIAWTRRNREWVQSGIVQVFAAMADTIIPAIATGAALAARAWYGWLMAIDLIKVAVNTFWGNLAEGFGWLLDKMAGLARLAKQDEIGGVLERLSEGADVMGSVFRESADEAKRGIQTSTEELDKVDQRIAGLSRSSSAALRRIAADAKDLGAAFREAAEQPVPPGADGPGGDGEADKAKEEAHKRYLGRLTERFKEEKRIRRRALDLQLKDIEAADLAWQEQQRKTVAYFIENWEQGASIISGALQGIGSAIEALGGNAEGAVAAQKAFAVAAIAINTAVAASRAYAELGPYAGTVAAAGIIAAGVASVAAVLATQPGSTQALQVGAGDVRPSGAVGAAGGVNDRFRAPTNAGVTEARELRAALEGA